MTARTWYEQLLRVEGRRLALLAAAQYLEREHVTTDIGPAEKPLRSRDLGDVLISDRFVFEVARDLYQQASDLEQERASMERVEILVPDLPKTTDTEESDRPKTASRAARGMKELKLAG